MKDDIKDILEDAQDGVLKDSSIKKVKALTSKKIKSGFPTKDEIHASQKRSRSFKLKSQEALKKRQEGR